jgi:hypothetical protein
MNVFLVVGGFEYDTSYSEYDGDAAGESVVALTREKAEEIRAEMVAEDRYDFVDIYEKPVIA